MSRAPLLGLVLAGGASTRMRRDKAALDYHGKPQVRWTWELLEQITGRAFVSVRNDQTTDPLRADLPQIVDQLHGVGPIAGIVSALRSHPGSAFLVVACDLPFISRQTLDHLLSRRDVTRPATAYRSAHDGLPEPLCAIYEPSALGSMEQFLEAGRDCPRKFLMRSQALLLDQPEPHSLDNVNTPDEFADASRRLSQPA